jgi:hypothetical protein
MIDALSPPRPESIFYELRTALPRLTSAASGAVLSQTKSLLSGGPAVLSRCLRRLAGPHRNTIQTRLSASLRCYGFVLAVSCRHMEWSRRYCSARALWAGLTRGSHVASHLPFKGRYAAMESSGQGRKTRRPQCWASLRSAPTYEGCRFCRLG